MFIFNDQQSIIWLSEVGKAVASINQIFPTIDTNDNIQNTW